MTIRIGRRGRPTGLTMRTSLVGAMFAAVAFGAVISLWTMPAGAVAVTPGLNFAGIGDGKYGFVPTKAPPDANLAVGATQIVQAVNGAYAVFDKNTGALVQGPIPGNSPWAGFGGGCQNNDDGQPIVKYDQLANRWVLSERAVSTQPFLECLAVSVTSDATGAYFRYAFPQPYAFKAPKLGVWPDAYYLTLNSFQGKKLVGARVCALDRSNMLVGRPAGQVCFQEGSDVNSILPADLEGTPPPPSGSPNFLFNLGSNSLNEWKFHVDFTTPALSTLTGPLNIAVAPFTPACGGACIPQAGTAQGLDSHGNRLMYGVEYRNFGDHESLVVNHSVVVGTSVGIRWYEIRSPNGTPTIFQQGTFAPDGNDRWMGSMAMDQNGDIALGYSVSSTAMHPAVRYTGRIPSDPPGTMEAENTVINGGGSQITEGWGDYSGMTVDPVDDCTFFYTSEYLKTSGKLNWQTRIVSFRFPGCVPE